MRDLARINPDPREGGYDYRALADKVDKMPEKPIPESTVGDSWVIKQAKRNDDIQRSKEAATLKELEEKANQTFNELNKMFRSEFKGQFKSWKEILDAYSQTNIDEVQDQENYYKMKYFSDLMEDWYKLTTQIKEMTGGKKEKKPKVLEPEIIDDLEEISSIVQGQSSDDQPPPLPETDSSPVRPMPPLPKVIETFRVLPVTEEDLIKPSQIIYAIKNNKARMFIEHLAKPDVRQAINDERVRLAEEYDKMGMIQRMKAKLSGGSEYQKFEQRLKEVGFDILSSNAEAAIQATENAVKREQKIIPREPTIEQAMKK